jgi:hypothetical protein
VPSAPLDINVTDVFQTSCVVHWKPSKDNGGLPLLHYVVERLDMSVKGLFKFCNHDMHVKIKSHRTHDAGKSSSIQCAFLELSYL